MASKDSLIAIKNLLRCVHADGNQVTHAYLKETERDAKLKKICLSNLTPGMLILDIDKKRKLEKNICMSPLFSQDGNYSHNCACDYVLLRQDGKKIFVYYIELKSNNPSGYSGQFKSTQCFMHYVFDLANKLCGVHISIEVEKFILFHTDSKNATRRSLNKTPTILIKQNGANTPDSPKKFCVKNNDTVRCTQFF